MLFFNHNNYVSTESCRITFINYIYLQLSGLLCPQMHLHITILLPDNQPKYTCAKHSAIITSTETGLYGNHS